MCKSDTRWNGGKIAALLWSSSSLRILPPTPSPASFPEEDDVNFGPRLLDSSDVGVGQAANDDEDNEGDPLPIGIGLKFGTGKITMGWSGLSGGGNVANDGVANINMMTIANNHAAALALAHGGLGVPSNANATDCVAVANIQCGANPAYGFHHQQQHHQHPGSGMNEGTAGEQRLQNREQTK
jgi:hypothetical protein